MRILLSALALLALSLPAAAQQYPTIVGEWYAEDTPQDCGGPWSVKIQPLAWIEDELVCSFTDVARNGWEVTWNGTCSDGNATDPVRVVAREDNGRLFATFNGNPGWTALRRCNAKTSIAVPPSLEKLSLQYTNYAGDSDVAKKYWPDVVSLVSQLEGAAQLGEKLSVSVAEAGGYTFAMATGLISCGPSSHGCPFKVYQGGSEFAQFTACQDTGTHAISADGSRFYDCFNRDAGRLISELR